MSKEIPYRFDKTDDTAAVRQRHQSLGPAQETAETVAVAGRIMRLRTQGKLAFAELRDWTGAIQLFAGAEFTDGFQDLTRCSLGDWIGAKGVVMTTRRGELSVRVESWTPLAQARRGFGDKWHGVTDVDARWRHREMDLWANEGPREVLLARSEIVKLTRRYLEDRGFVEVETPVFHAVAGGASARPFFTHHNALDAELSLRIALELHLKRLVVGGLEKVFEIGRTFRNEGLSPRHNPEFTMLECYQAYVDYADMASLTESLVSHLAMSLSGTHCISYQGRPLDLSPPWRRATMAELVSESLGEPVALADGPVRLRALAEREGVAVEGGWGPGKLLLELYEKTTEARLWDPTFVMDYPREVSPLARPHRSDPDLVERFEAVVAGRELANAFSELADPDIQRENFEAQARAKAAGDQEAMSVDEDYLFALELGLPPTGGLGIGIDRLVMLLTDSANIREVIAFPTLRPQPMGSVGGDGDGVQDGVGQAGEGLA